MCNQHHTLHMPRVTHDILITHDTHVFSFGFSAQGGFHGSFTGLPMCNQHHTRHNHNHITHTPQPQGSHTPAAAAPAAAAADSALGAQRGIRVTSGRAAILNPVPL